MLDGTADRQVFDRSTQVPFRPGVNWARRRAKRTTDLVLAACALLVLLPVLVLIALAIRIETPGPALFRQRRIGLGNASFDILKFRTMRWEGPQENGELRQARFGDPRVTRVGRFLRRSSLDELPQLLNVMRGEMSFVGPRPHAPGTRAGGRPFEQVSAAYAARHQMPPGLTGLAQVRGWRGETDTEEKLLRRVESDLEYIETWSLRRDLAIIARTPVALLRGTNAF